MKMMNDPLVSIAIITYNSSGTICETLDSAISQDYDNYEAVVFDDCSLDDTIEVINAWRKKQPASRLEKIGFRIFQNKKNLGVAGNCNAALNNTKGKYIQLLAGDDLLFPYSVSERVRFAEENCLPVVFSKVEVFGDEDAWLTIRRTEKYAAYGYEMLKTDTHSQYLKLLGGNYIVGPAASFVNRRFLIKLGGYDERFPLLEDWPFFLKYMKNGYPVKLCDKVLERYRVSGHSLSHAASPAYVQSCYDFFVLVCREGLIHNGMQELAEQQEKQLEKLLRDARNNPPRRDKYQIDYHQLLQWVMLKQRNISPADFFDRNHLKKIAVYGMGDLAYLLINELKDTDVSIVYGIDGNIHGDFWGVHVISPEADFPDADAIIVTPVFAFDSICSRLRNKCEIPIISLEDVLYFQMKQENGSRPTDGTHG